MARRDRFSPRIHFVRPVPVWAPVVPGIALGVLIGGFLLFLWNVIGAPGLPR